MDVVEQPDREEDPPPRSESADEDRFYVSSPVIFNDLFAGNLSVNSASAQKVLNAGLTIRGAVAAISADSPVKRDKVRRFLEELSNMRKVRGGMISQPDFDRILGAFRKEEDQLLGEYTAARVKVGTGKPEILPRTPNQLHYIRCIRGKDIVFGIGPAGTGKTYLAMALAVSSLLSRECGRIILTRPAVEAGENLGFLPGDLQEKINPYLRPLHDALYDMMPFSDAEMLMDKGIIEVAPLAFMRGRTLNHSFIILDEAQNTTKEQMLMFLTRLGYGSKCVICGDPTQTDLPVRRESGLIHALDTLRSIEEIGICRFTAGDVVRHALVEKIVLAYQRADQEIRRKESSVYG